MFYKLGKWTVRFRWAIIAFWVVAIAVLTPFALRVSSQFKSGFGDVSTESDVAYALMQQEMGISGSSLTLVFSSDSFVYTDRQYLLEMQTVLDAVSSVPAVKEVVTAASSVNPNMVSTDGHTTYATVLLATGYEGAMDVYPQVRQKAADTEHLKVWTTGIAPIFADIRDLSESDLRRSETITFPLVLVALLVVFGGLVAAGLPVLLGGVSVAIALGLLYFVAQTTDVSIFALNLVSLLGLGVAIDYSLLVVNRFREEIAARPLEEAVAHTMATAGRALLFSGVTSVIGLSGLLLFQLMMLRSLGLGGILVIGISLLVALTLLPAALAVLGKRVGSLSVLPRRAAAKRRWQYLAGWVMRHPVLVAVPLILLLVILGTPMLSVKIGSPWSAHLPPDAPSAEGWDVVSREIGPGELSPVLVLARTPGDILSPETVGRLYDFVQGLEQDPRVQRVESIVSIDPGITRQQYPVVLSNPALLPPPVREAVDAASSLHSTLIRVYPRYSPFGDESRALVTEIRSSDLGGDISLYVGGDSAGQMDYTNVMYSDFPYVIIYIIVAIYVALLLLFRSVIIPLKAVIMNAMSIFASYGALVFIFQQGHFQGLLNFQATGYLDTTVPIILFCIVFGLSMDYEIFLLSRIKEVYDAGGDNTQSVGEGLEHTGAIITSAALILVLVAVAFATGQVVFIKALGIGVAVAVLLDASIVRALLVPALMRIMGDWNWWAPRWLQRLLPDWRTPG